MEQCVKYLLVHIPFRIRFFPQPFRKMSTFQGKTADIAGRSYADAICTLNSLQSNAQLLAQIRQKRATEDKSTIIPETIKMMEKAGVTQELINTLNIIHVAGTKGKGTTCAFTESILRKAGLRTGFFSSPHLISVRERIKIDGKPISPEKFAQYFFRIHGALSSKEDDVPAYFRFLTCMAFHVFLEEKVDVAIIEVGIGGRYDSTNVASKPAVVGITSLGLEHQAILGQTIEEIALNKAGIMKEKVPTFTVPNHPPHVLQLLKNHAINVNCPLHVVPTLEDFPLSFNLSVDDGNVSRLNAALAIQLSNSLLSQKYPKKLSSLKTEPIDGTMLGPIMPFHLEGLNSTVWPGRFQVIPISENLKYFLDGAHTHDSLSIALNWFQRASNLNSYRVMIFNMTGDRLASDFLHLFANSKIFDLVVFSPIARRYTPMNQDNWSAVSDKDKTLCQEHLNLWSTLNSGAKGVVSKDIDEANELMQQLASTVKNVHNGCSVQENGNSQVLHRNKPIEVLVTGSLHLVGNFLSILDPNLCNNNNDVASIKC